MRRPIRLRNAGYALALVAAIGGFQQQSGFARQTRTDAANDDSMQVVSPPVAATITDSEIRDVVTRVARHQVRTLADGEYPQVTSIQEAAAARAPDGISWSYPWGVALYGLLRSTDVTGDRDVDNFVTQHDEICSRYYAWLAGLEKAFPGNPDLAAFAGKTAIRGLVRLGNLDSCGAMGTQLVEMMLRHPDRVTDAEKQVAARIADWVVEKQDRLPDGTLWRSKNMGGTVWPDDLYMGGAFLVRWSKYTGNDRYLEDAANQIIRQAALEQDADGLWVHGYFVNEKKRASFKWGRGNGWVTVTLVEALSSMPEKHPLRPQLLSILTKQIDGLKKVQAPDGMWRQVLDRPELWEETSCTAMFAYGIARAVNRGWLDASSLAMARRAFAGLSRNVTADGRVNGTCQGTNIGMDLDFYMNRPRPDDDLHGRGPVLLAGTELLASPPK